MTPSIDNGHPVFLLGLGKAPLPCPTPETASRVMKTRRFVKSDTSSWIFIFSGILSLSPSMSQKHDTDGLNMAVDVDRVIASLTLAGSGLSCLATTFVLISFIIYRRHLRSFRHVLVLNLVVAGTLFRH